MIVIRLNGGLGNQFFQYALGRRLSIERQTILRFDLGTFESDPQREYELYHFNTAGVPISKQELHRFLWWHGSKITKVCYEALQFRKAYYRRTVVNERTPAYDPNILKVPETVYLSGYWQSEKYFLDIQNIIRQDFTFKVEQDLKSQEVARMIKNTQSVSIHMRRGDYVSNVETNRVHGICDLDYYKQCVSKIAEKISNPHFFVFSDDPDWVTTNFHLNYPVTFVVHNDASRNYEDLRLMSMCKHNIIANSSFSWWGAWRNQNQEKLVFAPKKWFNDPKLDTKDLIPCGWEKL